MIDTSVTHVLDNFLQKHAHRNKANSSLITVTALTIHLNGTLFTKKRIFAAAALSRVLIGCQNAKANSALYQIENRLHLIRSICVFQHVTFNERHTAICLCKIKVTAQVFDRLSRDELIFVDKFVVHNEFGYVLYLINIINTRVFNIIKEF